MSVKYSLSEGIFLQNSCFHSGYLGNFVVVQLFSIPTDLYQHTFPFSSYRLSATDTVTLSGVQLSIPSSVTYSQSPAGGLSCGDNVGGIGAGLFCMDYVCAVQLMITTVGNEQLMITTVGNEKMRLPEMGQQINCKAVSQTCCLKTKRGFQLCSNFRINLRREQPLSSCHAELDAETLQRRRGGELTVKRNVLKISVLL